MFGMIPFDRSERNLFNYLDQMERNFWNGSISGAMQFRCDVQDKGDRYLLEAELPGFDANDININLEGERLTISAQRDECIENKTEDGSYLRRERKLGAFSRSFDVSTIDTDHIDALYKNGVLELSLPKKTAQVSTGRHIQISNQ